MTTRTFWTGTFGILLSLAFGHAAQALPARMTVAGPTNQPIGHYEFCKQHPDECGTTGANDPLVLNEANWKQILEINYTVNNSVEPLTDDEIYGVEERWTYPGSVGDCEDYVVTKRARLIRMGLPPGALRIAFAKTRSGEGHAVLIVRTTKGDYVLDNRTSAIRPMSQTGLRFISMSTANPKKWVAA